MRVVQELPSIAAACAYMRLRVCVYPPPPFVPSQGGGITLKKKEILGAEAQQEFSLGYMGSAAVLVSPLCGARGGGGGGGQYKGAVGMCTCVHSIRACVARSLGVVRPMRSI